MANRKELYVVEYDDKLHLADAKGIPGGKRALLQDDDNDLKGQAVLHPVSDEELKRRNGGDAPRVEEKRELSPEAQALIEHAVDRVIDGLIHLGTTYIVPGAKRIYKEEVKSRATNALHALKSRRSVRKEENPSDQTAAVSDKATKSEQSMRDSELATRPTDVEIPDEEPQALHDITHQEAIDRIARIKVMSQLVSDDLEFLRHCRIVGYGDEGLSLDWSHDAIGFDETVHDVISRKKRFLTEADMAELSAILDLKMFCTSGETNRLSGKPNAPNDRDTPQHQLA